MSKKTNMLFCCVAMAGQAMAAPAAEHEADVVVYGSSPAAISCAIQAKRMGKTCIVVSPETRIGGLTTGGLGQTDIGNKSAFGGIAIEFYRAVAAHYRDDANWTRQKRNDYLPDGQCEGTKGEDSMWTFEPSAALKILEGWEKRDGLVIHRGERLCREKGKVEVEGRGLQRRIRSFVTEDGKTYRGKMFVDATYEGDLMAAAGVSYTVGREANAVYGETISGIQRKGAVSHQFHPGVSAYVKEGDPSSGLLPCVEKDVPDPDGTGDRRVQAYCFRMCLTDVPENRIPFKKPANYRELDYELLFREFAQSQAHPEMKGHGFLDFGAAPNIMSMMPNRKTDTNNRTAFSTDFIGQNYAWPEASYAEREKILKAHLDYQQGLMWTLANHPRIPKATRDYYSKWGTCKDEFKDGLGDGWQRQLYVREARRLVGDYVVSQMDCLGKRVSRRPVALAAYGMDSHHCRRYVDETGCVRNEGDIQDWSAGGRPYPIDYGALVPKRAECANLFVPVCVSASHMAFGSIRMEPVFFALGQVAATAAAQAIDAKCAVQDVPYAPLRERLLADGQKIGGQRPFTVLPLGIGMDRTTEEVAKTIRAVKARAGVDKVVLHAPGHGVRTSGYYDEAGYRGVGRRVKSIQDAVRKDGVEVGFLMGPTMNVGINHPWTKFVMKDGKVRPFTACPGDPAFRKAFAAHCAAVAEECRPFLYMMEDDFRLFWGTGCYCERHKANPTQAFEDLVQLAQEAAKAIHRVSSKTRIGLSAPGGYTHEAARLARVLADGGRPFIRWYGSEYGFDNPMRLPDFLWTPIWCKQHLSDGMECVYEADACPNTAFYGSGARVAACASIVLANGFDGLWYWLTGVGGTETGDPLPNLDTYERCTGDLAALGACAREGRPVGLSAMTAPAGRLLARYGIPYKTTAGGIEFYAGAETFSGKSDDEIRKILAGRVLLDGDAARALTARGFEKEIGVKAWDRSGAIDFAGECVCASHSLIGSSYHQNYGMDGSEVRRLEPVGGEEISYYYSGAVSNRVQSSVTRQANALGGKVVVLAACLTDCTATNLLNFRKRNLLLEQLAWLGGEAAVPVRTDRHVNVLVFANENTERLFVHATQLSCQPVAEMSFVVAPAWRGGRVELLEKGAWKPTGSVSADGRIKVARPTHVYDTVSFRVFCDSKASKQH